MVTISIPVIFVFNINDTTDYFVLFILNLIYNVEIKNLLQFYPNYNNHKLTFTTSPLPYMRFFQKIEVVQGKVTGFPNYSSEHVLHAPSPFFSHLI